MMSSTGIAITGASGFIGKSIVSEAAENGRSVVALSRSGTPVAGADRNVTWSLGDPIPTDAHRKCDFAIHLAHDFGGAIGARNTITGTLLAIENFRAAGARHQIFFSSLSAHPGATSRYGRTKFAIECAIKDHLDVSIVRPGLVLGNGGVFGRIRNWVRAWPIAPLPDGGLGKINVIDIRVLSRETLRLLFADTRARELNWFLPESVTLRELVLQEAKASGRRVFVIPVPSWLLFSLLTLTDQLNLPTPVTSDNLAGFLANQSSYFLPTPVLSS